MIVKIKNLVHNLMSFRFLENQLSPWSQHLEHDIGIKKTSILMPNCSKFNPCTQIIVKYQMA